MGRRAVLVSAYPANARPRLVVPPDGGTLLLTATGH